MGKRRNQDEALADAYLDKAIEIHESENVEFDDDDVVVEIADDGSGAWVQGWFFVPSRAIGMTPEPHRLAN